MSSSDSDSSITDGTLGSGARTSVDSTDVDTQELQNEVQTIMNNVVLQSSINRYTNGIINFFMGF